MELLIMDSKYFSNLNLLLFNKFNLPNLLTGPLINV